MLIPIQREDKLTLPFYWILSSKSYKWISHWQMECILHIINFFDLFIVGKTDLENTAPLWSTWPSDYFCVLCLKRWKLLKIIWYSLLHKYTLPGYFRLPKLHITLCLCWVLPSRIFNCQCYLDEW